MVIANQNLSEEEADEAMNQYKTDDVRILEIQELVTPNEVIAAAPITDSAARNVYETRQAIHRILHGADDRLLVIIGPCSIHDIDAAREYASKLAESRAKHSKDLLIVMRVYFE